MKRPLASLVCVVHGPVFARYAAQLAKDVSQHWFGGSELIVLPAVQGWPQASSERRRVVLEWRHEIKGEHIFLIDADMRILKPVSAEILADGLTVTTHPGHQPGNDGDLAPFCRDPASRAYVPLGTAGRYYPGAFHGGPRDAFLDLCDVTSKWTTIDLLQGIHPVWYDESYLNRYLLDNPPALELDRRYCWWHNQWGPDDDAIIMHLDKTVEEFEEARRP